MKKQKKTVKKRLALVHTTIRVLDDKQKRDVVGGGMMISKTCCTESYGRCV